MPRAKFARRSGGQTIAVALGATLYAVSACTQDAKTPGQLVVAIDTDMALPDQIDTIEIQVTDTATGAILLDNPMPVGTGVDTQPIPATLTLIAGNPSAAATIRVVGMRNGVARTLREVTTTIPTDRIATLRMPVQWLCDGTAQATSSADAGVSYASSCGPGETCQAGSCVLSKVAPTALPSYQADDIFGGGAAPADGGTTAGTCFDTIACLVGGTIEPPDDTCSVGLPSGGAGVNVGLRVANDGICDVSGETCFVALDAANPRSGTPDNPDGWSEVGGRIALPLAVCTKLQNGLIAGVTVSTSCPTKTDAVPPCGPWSSVVAEADASSGSRALDAAVPTTPILVGSAAGDAGASTACCPLMADGTRLYTCLCDGTGRPGLVAMDPSSGVVTAVGTFSPQAGRAAYAGVVAGSDFYWVDRTSGGVADGSYGCPLYATSTTDGATGAALAIANADVYLQGAVLLADVANLYALADDVSGLPSTASAVQLLRIARDTGVVTPLDTGGTAPVFQFAQDGAAIYVAVDTDVAQGEAGVERISRIVSFPKAGGPSTNVAENTVLTADLRHGGTIGLEDDGTSLFSLFEAGPASDGTIDTRVVNLNGADAAPATVYEEVVDPSHTQLRLLGAVNGAVLLVRDVTLSDAGALASESSVLVIPASGGAPRIVASFRQDTPIFEVQTPTFTSDVFWLNQSGRVFRLPAAALR